MKKWKVFLMKFKSFFRFNSSIKAKLIIISILILTIPMVILSILNYQKSSTSLDELGKTNLKNSVEMTMELIGALNHEVEKGNISLEEAQEQVKMAILGEKNTDGTRPINKHIDLGEHGYMFVLDQKGNRVAHPTIEGTNAWDSKNPVDIENAKKIFAAGKKGDFVHYSTSLPDDKNQIEQKVNYAKNDPYWGWTIVAGTFMLDFNKPANEMFNLNSIVLGITLLVGLFIIWVFANSISQPIKKVTERMYLLTHGDLSQEPIQIKSKDETSQLANSMNEMQNTLKDIIGNISNASEVMTSKSEELTQSANEVMTGSEQIVATMQELASGAETQADGSVNLSSVMEVFAAKVQEANKNGEYIHQSSNEILVMTDKGCQLMDSSTSQMGKIDQIVQDSVHNVQNLNAQSQEISKLVVVIKDVADQTNLLALNAAIEAARAGEHGKGFAVVADEVRKLAEQTATSVTDITGIVNNMQKEVGLVTESLQEGYKEVEQGTSQIKSTGETFNEISMSVKEMVNSIKMISDESIRYCS